MSQAIVSVDTMWAAFRAMPQESRGQLLERMLADATVRDEIEDLLDLTLAEQRRGKPARSLDDVLSEIDQ